MAADASSNHTDMQQNMHISTPNPSRDQSPVPVKNIDPDTLTSIPSPKSIEEESTPILPDDEGQVKEFTLRISDDPVKTARGIYILSYGNMNVEMVNDDVKDRVFLAIVKALLKVNNSPMTPKEISQTILRLKLTPLGGSTPNATISSRLSQHYKKAAEFKPNGRTPLLGREPIDPSSRKLHYFILQEGIPVNQPLAQISGDTEAGGVPPNIDLTAGTHNNHSTRHFAPPSPNASNLVRKVGRPPTSSIISTPSYKNIKSQVNPFASDTAQRQPPLLAPHEPRYVQLSHTKSNILHNKTRSLGAAARPFPNGGGKSLVPLLLAAEAILGQDDDDVEDSRLGRQDSKGKHNIDTHKRRPRSRQQSSRRPSSSRESSPSSDADDEDDDIDNHIPRDSLNDLTVSSNQSAPTRVPLDIRSFDWEGSEPRSRLDSGEWVLGTAILQSPRAPKLVPASPWRATVAWDHEADTLEDPLNRPLTPMLSPRAWRDVRPPESVSVNELDRLWVDERRHNTASRSNNDLYSPKRTPRKRKVSSTFGLSPSFKKVQKTPHDLFGIDEPARTSAMEDGIQGSDDARKPRKTVKFGDDTDTTPSRKHKNDESGMNSSRSHIKSLINATGAFGRKRSSSSGRSATGSGTADIIVEPSPKRARLHRRANSPNETQPTTSFIPSTNYNISPTVPVGDVTYLEASEPPLDLDPSTLELHSPQKSLSPSSPHIYIAVVDGVGLYITWLKASSPQEQHGIPLMRRLDTDMVHGATLLYAGGMFTEKERSIVLSLERGRVRHKGHSPLMGTWISLFRARNLASTCSLDAVLEQFLSDDLSSYFDPTLLAAMHPPSPPMPLITPYGTPILLNSAQYTPIYPTLLPSSQPLSRASHPPSPLNYFTSTLAALLANQQVAQQNGLPVPELDAPKEMAVNDNINPDHRSAITLFMEAFKTSLSRKVEEKSVGSLLPAAPAIPAINIPSTDIANGK
ncbi:hypothetical protein SmJEL517_g05560 [Synchytrium microbalum]|uniref:GDS1 winged helix domain-containing protein n=1 Tax=Synchytrium microbalum TaxID=1806994 RepID=A0A507BZ52_9FUNG|nr:uncharacterized protein SmJEL517_g05560 [Synchytrium microbalum]TPX31026.1 hypothetical protein SmJEL517_g05560 [Synchytrium microbalum]